MLDLSIIIINFNTRDLTMKLLESIFKYTRGVTYEVIVVDNASEDKSVSEIKRKYRAKVTVIKNKENSGFGAGNNQAMNIAQGRYFCLLNSDTLLIGNAFEKMIEWFDQNTFVPIKSSRKINPEEFNLSSLPHGTIKRYPIGLLGCKLLNPDRTEQYSIKRFPTLSTMFGSLFLERFIRPGMPEKITEVNYVMGAFMLLKREVYERVGGFDEKIFMYVEETDWCYRIRKHGFSVVYWPDVSIIHYGGGSAIRGRKDQILNAFAGYRYFYRKHYKKTSYTWLIALIKIKSYSSLLFGRLTGNKYLVSTYTEALDALKDGK
ncbi:MAG: glycosyltransferase family 2 protein [bacterium]|nr:glycosyltransferase family 2 protein [bacterium]